MTSTSQKYRTKVKGLDFNKDVTLQDVINSYATMGGQSKQIADAITMLNEILELRKNEDPSKRPYVFFGFTSNMISCGIREIIRFIAKNKLVDVMCTTCGGLEEDIMKTFEPAYVADYLVNDRKWRTEGKNRIGNMVVPNDNYCEMEDWLGDILDDLMKEQKETGNITSASQIVERMGKKMNNPESVYYWCAKNNIPVFSPGVTDGAIGDICYFRSFKNEDFIIDSNKDLCKIMDLGVKAGKTEGRPLVALILGGGLVKYHLLNAAKMGGGLDYGLFITVGSPFDGSNSGALPDQEISRGAIKPNAKLCSVRAEASLVFPVIAAGSFMNHEIKE